MKRVTLKQRLRVCSVAHRIIRSLLVILSLLLHSSGLYADQGGESAVLQCRDKPKNPVRAKRLAGDLFARAERAFNDKQYIKALKRFLCSLSTVEHEATVTNIEEILRVIENKETACALLEDYLEANPDGELTPRLSEITEAMKIELGLAEPPPPEKKPEDEPKVVEKVVPPAPVCISAIEPKPYIEHAEQDNNMQKVFSLVTLGAGAAFIIAGGVFQGLSILSKQSADDADSYEAFLDDAERNKQFQAAAIAGFASGAITAGIGAYQFVIALKQQKQLNQLKAYPTMSEKCKTLESTEKASSETGVEVGINSVSLSLRF
jgi:hypothetical protein